jgi:hypothetical protein
MDARRPLAGVSARGFVRCYLNQLDGSKHSVQIRFYSATTLSCGYPAAQGRELDHAGPS